MQRYVAVFLILTLSRIAISQVTEDTDVDFEVEGMWARSPDPSSPINLRFLKGGKANNVVTDHANLEFLGGEVHSVRSFGNSHLVVRDGVIGEIFIELGTRLELYGDLDLTRGLFVDPESGLHPITERPENLPGGASLQAFHLTGTLSGGSPINAQITVMDIWTDEWQANNEPFSAVYLNDRLVYSIATHLEAIPEPTGFALLLSGSVMLAVHINRRRGLLLTNR